MLIFGDKDTSSVNYSGLKNVYSKRLKIRDGDNITKKNKSQESILINKYSSFIDELKSNTKSFFK